MRFKMSIGLGVIAVVASAATASAQSAKAPHPETTACPDAIASIATCYTARHPSGAYLLAAMPKEWNGNLIVYAHGGPSLVPYTANYGRLDLTKFAIEVRRGFAWVASSYRREGYGVRMAAEDSEDARQFFVEHLGKPRRTLVQGSSYGGLVGAKVLDMQARDPNRRMNYDGGLLNSGLLSGPLLGYAFRVDLRVVYQHVCKNLPRPNEQQYPLWQGVAADSKMSLKDLQLLVDECTGVTRPAAERTAAQSQNLADIVGVIGIPENLLYRHMQSATLLFRGIVRDITAGGNPFSNMGVRYKGSTDDERLNREIARFAADSAAVAALRADGDPTGAMNVPVLSIHSIKDPQVAVESQSVFRQRVVAAGNGERLVQAYTDDHQHNQHSDPELAAAFEALVQWIDKGDKPTPQGLAASCEQLQARHDGLCRFRPDFEPGPFNTRYYAREATTR